MQCKHSGTTFGQQRQSWEVNSTQGWWAWCQRWCVWCWCKCI